MTSTRHTLSAVNATKMVLKCTMHHVHGITVFAAGKSERTLLHAHPTMLHSKPKSTRVAQLHQPKRAMLVDCALSFTMIGNTILGEAGVVAALEGTLSDGYICNPSGVAASVGLMSTATSCLAHHVDDGAPLLMSATDIIAVDTRLKHTLQSCTSPRGNTSVMKCGQHVKMHQESCPRHSTRMEGVSLSHATRSERVDVATGLLFSIEWQAHNPGDQWHGMHYFDKI